MVRLSIRAALFYLMVVSSIISLLTGVILYLWPHGPRSGRILILGVDKVAWSEWHTYISLFAMIVIIIHVAVNRKLVKLYARWVMEGRSA